MALAEALPSLNAGLNALSAGLLVAGWRAIRGGRQRLHRALMLAACGSSTLFLAGYLTRIALTGTHRFPGGGALRLTYLAVLASHTVLAALTLPLVLRTLQLSLGARFAEHRRVARVTFPVWIYVSLTGVAVYVMLYRLAPHAPCARSPPGGWPGLTAGAAQRQARRDDRQREQHERHDHRRHAHRLERHSTDPRHHHHRQDSVHRCLLHQVDAGHRVSEPAPRIDAMLDGSSGFLMASRGAAAARDATCALTPPSRRASARS
jgi:putative membrane protein